MKEENNLKLLFSIFVLIGFSFLLISDLFYRTNNSYHNLINSSIGVVLYGVITFGLILLSLFILVRHSKKDNLIKFIAFSSVFGLLIPIGYGLFNYKETYNNVETMIQTVFPIVAVIASVYYLYTVFLRKK